jgi:hypothetical protein
MVGGPRQRSGVPLAAWARGGSVRVERASTVYTDGSCPLPEPPRQMEASSLAVQEILDQVLGHLAAHSDLKSCALVCRAFVSSAQALLFHHARTRFAGWPHIPSYVDGRRRPLMMSTDRLTDFASRAPHLIDHIRELSIDGCDSETLAPIVEIPWSRLRAIAFERAGSRDMGPLAADVFALIGTLVELPTLREISFSSFYCGPELPTQLCCMLMHPSHLTLGIHVHVSRPSECCPRAPFLMLSIVLHLRWTSRS